MSKNFFIIGVFGVHSCIGQTNFLKPDLPHEMGHCFGLFHTHETSLGVENVNGSNGTTAGDKISDTPADPNLFGRMGIGNCEYTGTTLQNGLPFTPDVHNIMSNTNYACQDRFSPLQVNAMYNTILNNSFFADMRAATNSYVIPIITGTIPICSNNQFTVSGVQSPFFTFWSSSNTSVATTGNNFLQRDKIIVSKVSNGFTTLTANVTDFCNNYSASKRIAVGTPVEGTYTYGYTTYPVNTPSTGIGVSGSTIYVNLSPVTSTQTYSWTTVSNGGSSSFSQNGSGNQVSIYVSGGSYRNMSCISQNSCGTSDPVTFNCYNYSYYQVLASPNPTSQDLSVTTNLISGGGVGNRGEKLLKTKDLNQTPVKLVDSNNRVIASGKLTNGIFTFRLSTVPNGTYILQVSEGEDLVTKQILVQH
jgi:hypothetical protein